MISSLFNTLPVWLTTLDLFSTNQLINFMSRYTLPWGTHPPYLAALLIFSLRMVNLTLSTLRMLSIIQGRRWIVWLLALANSLLFILSVNLVLGDLTNPWNLIAYAIGFATGSVLGITIESKIAPGYALVRIVSATRGRAILDDLHGANLGATELSGQGRSGFVSIIHCYTQRRRSQPLMEHVLHSDPDAFVTIEHVRHLRGGWTD